VVTVRVTTLKGSGAGRYYTERLPSYYLDGDDPPGRWWGNGADRLGLPSEVDPEAFLAVMAGQDPATQTDLGRRYGEESVRGYDATFSAPKSVSVLFALGDETTRREVVEAHEGAVEAVLGWIEDHAHTRIRDHGHVMCVDAQGIVVGVFRQHTSRRLDPQLHTHAVIANKVRAPDGRWLALDARTIKIDQRTLSALYHAGLRAELTRRLGVQWRPPEHGIAEVAGIDEAVLEAFSQRSHDMQRRLDEKLARFRTDMGREPTEKERWKLEREAVLDSRPAKPHGPTLPELHHEWRLRVQVMGRHSGRIVEAMVGRQRRLEGIDADRAVSMAKEAVSSLSDQQSSWRPAELVRELAAVTPTTVTADARQLTEFLQRLADQVAAARCVDISKSVASNIPRRRDGRPITEAAVNRALTTQGILDEEEYLVGWAERRKNQGFGRPRARPIRFADHLTKGQVAVVAAVADGDDLELVVGPAGAGKTTTLAAAALNLSVRGHIPFGLAPTAAAAEVLATEADIPADTLDKLLTEHSHPSRPPQPGYDLRAGTTVIVDEAATAATPKLAALARLADQHQWRVVLVGDPRQFAAVGRGGMFAHLVDTHGATELEQVHRFSHEWERRASLRLRAGDPTVLAEYERRGRLHGGTLVQMEAGIIDAWHQARRRGETAALMANSTDSVARLNHFAQQARIQAGELDVAAPALRIGDEKLRVGDEVVTRRNDRTLRTDQGHMVKNRDHWTITAIHPDGRVALAGRTGIIRLPADYVTEHLQLGYAQTSHATQGRTVDTSLLLIDTPTDTHGVYTPMTRGRQANHAYVATEENHTARDVLTAAITRDWIDQPAITHRDLDPHRPRQLEPRDPNQTRGARQDGPACPPGHRRTASSITRD
jgi:conjugative relaxase-like TrwC/TraI family protein